MKDLCPCPGSRACPSIHPTGTEHANASYSLLRTRGAEHGPAAASQPGYGAQGWDLGGCRALGGSQCCPHSSGWLCARHLVGTCPSVPVPLVLPAPSPVPSSLPRSQLAARQGCRWARDFFFFCRALSDSPVGLLKHLVSLSRRHYELININSLFWYLLLPGALAWDFIYLFLFYSPSPPKMETDGSRLCLGESWGRPRGWGTMGSLSPSFRAGGIGAGERFPR